MAETYKKLVQELVDSSNDTLLTVAANTTLWSNRILCHCYGSCTVRRYKWQQNLNVESTQIFNQKS